MHDRGPDDDEDHAWLLARERGEPGPTIADARAGRYSQIGTLIADLPAMPAATAHRSGWEQDVLAAIDAEAGPPTALSTTPAAAVTDEPLPQQPTPTRRYRRAVTTAAALFVMVAGVAIVLFVHRDRRPDIAVTASALDVDRAQRERSHSQKLSPKASPSMYAEQRRLDFDHTLQVRRSNAVASHELRDGDFVMTGDRIRASVITSADAHLYLAFCAGQHLQIYPSQRGVLVRPGDVVPVPEGGGELVLDRQTGSDVLYLIVSRSELSVADPQLAALLVATGDAAKPVDCGARLDLMFMKSTASAPANNVLRGESITKEPTSPSLAESLKRPADPREMYLADSADEAILPATVVAADADGIAVVRYRFTHVAEEDVEDMKPRPN